MSVEQVNFDKIDFLINYVATKAPLPYWMSGFRLGRQELKELDQVQKTAYRVARDIHKKRMLVGSTYARQVVFPRMLRQALEIVRT